MSVAIDQVPIFLNGEATHIPGSMSLPALLETLDIDPATVRGIAVAINDEVVRRKLWAETIITEGDRVEIVTATQGG